MPDRAFKLIGAILLAAIVVLAALYFSMPLLEASPQSEPPAAKTAH